MAYNKASEEKKWLAWKEAEEKKMRELGVSEDTIQELHVYDWEMFKKERNYYRHIQESGSYLETLFSSEDQKEIRTVEDLLDEIDNPELFDALRTVDSLTLSIAVLRMQGMTFAAISKEVGLTKNATQKRFYVLRKKLKNFSE